MYPSGAELLVTPARFQPVSFPGCLHTRHFSAFPEDRYDFWQTALFSIGCNLLAGLHFAVSTFGWSKGWIPNR